MTDEPLRRRFVPLNKAPLLRYHSSSAQKSAGQFVSKVPSTVAPMLRDDSPSAPYLFDHRVPIEPWRTTQHHGSSHVDQQALPWYATETFFPLIKYNRLLDIDIHAHIEKGFFLSGNQAWTTYRRNYFTLTACWAGIGQDLDPFVSNEVLVKRNQDLIPIVSLAFRLRAEVSGDNDKTIELIGNVPTRDKEPPKTVTLPLLSQSRTGVFDSTTTVDNKTVVWERIQFKTATANNGRRRAIQQYYHLIVELLAKPRSSDDSNGVDWICIAQRKSYPLVVRGRSPSHYQGVDGRDAPTRFPGFGYHAQKADSLRSRDGIIEEDSTHLPNQEGGEQEPREEHNRAISSPMHLLSTHTTDSKETPQINIQEKELKFDYSVIRDDSSVSSQGSRWTSFSLLDTASSRSSVRPVPISFQFASALVGLQGVEPLLKDCFALSTPDRCERNIRRLLKELGARLANEGENKSQRLVARALIKHHSGIAAEIKTLCSARLSSGEVLPLDLIESQSEFSMGRYLAEHDATVLQPLLNSQESKARFPEYCRMDPSLVQLVHVDESIDLPGLSDDEEGSVRVTQRGAVQSDLQFLQSSEAIQDFCEGLLDFRVAVENTKHNERARLASRPRSPRTQPNILAGRNEGSTLIVSLKGMYEKAQKYLKPAVREGHRRVEWRCDCGKLLHADFDNTDSMAVDAIAHSLANPRTSQSPQPAGNNISPNNVTSPATQPVFPSSGITPSRPSNLVGNSTGATIAVSGPSSAISAKYLAICITTGGIYKTLIELDVSNIKSDASLFQAMKASYHKARGYKSRLTSLFKPVSVEFVHFSLWNIRRGLISICDRPESMPPVNSSEYDFAPKPLRPLPPMPPEIFIHYLEHGDDDLNPIRCDWLPRLPKRVDGRMIDQSNLTYGWGIYVKEGPNREVIFWIIIATVLASLVLSICWSGLRDDVQGGSGLGTLVLTLPTVVMAAFIFRFTNHD